MFTRFRKTIAAFFICCTLLFTVQRANAFFDEFGTYGPQLAVAAAGSSGSIAAVAAGGTFLGLTPIGWAAIGLALLASVMITSDTQGNKVAVVVSTRSAADDPNPDIATAPSTNLSGSFYAPRINSVTYPYLYALTSDVQAGTGPGYIRFSTRLVQQLSALGYYAVLFDIGSGAAWGTYGSTDTYCPTGGCWYIQAKSGVAGANYSYTTGTCPAGIVCRQITTPTTTSPGVVTLYIPMTTTTGIDCPSGSSYDFNVGSCLTTPPSTSLADGVCRITWASNGCPVRNPFDPDCSGVQLATSCGNSTTPPSVTVTDPTTGKSLKTEKPAVPAQGTPGTVKLTERTPDPKTNTTTEKVTQTAPNPTPGQAPTTNGSGQATYPGTGTNTSPTPATSVAVSNWPQGLDSIAGYLQIIAGNTAQQGNTVPPAVNVNFPERMKIDNEGHTESDVPNASSKLAEFESKPGGFMKTLTDKLNPFSSFTVPVHSAQCPSIDISWHAWNLNLDVHSNALCNTLETPDYKTVIQAMMILLYTVAAIMIILGA